MNQIPASSVTDLEDTIAAISTPPGEGGIGIVRISGSQSLNIAARVFVSSSGRDFLFAQQKVFHGHVLDSTGTVIDEVLAHRMRAPHSFTREDVVEFSAHGGALPLNMILERVLSEGARLSRAGEFTHRAFMNGRIDLVQAEAIMDLIQARTHAALQAANNAAQGRLSREIYALHDTLADALAQIEAAVDFPEEDTPEYVTPQLLDGLKAALLRIQEMLLHADAGRMLREGATVALAGRTNVGKSSLFNALLRDSRAIVTEVAGTTRDRIEEYANIGGVPVKLVDTAGVRETDDTVERIGVEIAWDTARNANLVLWVLDISQGMTEEDADLGKRLAELEIPVFAIWNKVDIAANTAFPSLPMVPKRQCVLSAKTGEGLPQLEGLLVEYLLGGAHIGADQAMLSRAHQKDSLRRAEESLLRLLGNTGNSPEFLALELREALSALGEITGECTSDDILEKIFSSFCIGK